MNRKFGVLAILILGFLLIAGIIYYVFYFSVNKQKIQTSNEPEKTIDTSHEVKTIENKEEKPKEVVKPIIKTKDVPFGQVNLERIARSFAERFGSFSNQSNFSNISDLKMVMSKKMQNWAENYIEKNRKSNVASDVYYGMTTKALSTDVESFDETNGKAVITVETRRREAIGTTNNASKLFNQNISIVFVKENRAWKVDSAYWQD